MPDIAEIKKEYAKKLKSYLATRGDELAQCGSQKPDPPDFDETKGFWKDSGVTNKPVRYLVHLRMTADGLVAEIPNAHGSKRLGYANTSGRNVGALTVRIVPSILKADGKFELYGEWEWTLILIFDSTLPHGTSGQLFEDFDPSTGNVKYMGSIITPAKTVLVSLVDSADAFTIDAENQTTITYGQASEALINLFGLENYTTNAPNTNAQSMEDQD